MDHFIVNETEYLRGRVEEMKATIQAQRVLAANLNERSAQYERDTAEANARAERAEARNAELVNICKAHVLVHQQRREALVRAERAEARVAELADKGTLQALRDANDRAERAERQLKETEARLPDGMKHCTIQFKECAEGHGRLTATNWVQHGCPFCALNVANARIVALASEWRIAYNKLVAEGDTVWKALEKWHAARAAFFELAPIEVLDTEEIELYALAGKGRISPD